MAICLIDADILLYRSSAAADHFTEFGDWSDAEQAVRQAEDFIRRYVDDTGCDAYVLCLSDAQRNWRKKVLRDYKSHRKAEKPGSFWELRDHLLNAHPCFWVPWLEGDDLLGILATGGEFPLERRTWGPYDPDDCIVATIDKDLRTVPCHLYNPQHPQRGIESISLEEADYYHHLQGLMGDSCDGYSGIPGIGPKKARRILDGWDRKDLKTGWRLVRDSYKNAGLSATDALQTMRVARILRAGEWREGKVKFWQPPILGDPQPSSSTKPLE